MSVELNRKVFNSRLKVIRDAWVNASGNDDYSSIAEADALLIVAGDSADEDTPPRKSMAFQSWLLGYEFPSTFILFQKDKVIFLCSEKRGKYLKQVKGDDNPIPIEFMVHASAKDAPNSAVSDFVQAYSAHNRVGSLMKETHVGKVVKEWEAALASANSKPDSFDIAPALSCMMAVKDDEELSTVRTAASLTSTLLTHYIMDKLETILEKQAAISHESFAASIEGRLGSGEGKDAKGPDMKLWNKGRNLKDVDWAATEFCYSPIIQSKNTKGGFDLKASAQSSEDSIAHSGVFLLAAGIRYKGYCANVGRTIIVAPTKEQEDTYTFLLSLQTELLTKLKDGISARDAYQHAVSFVKDKKPDLEKHFVKNIGFGMGLEFRDSTYLLSPKNTHTLKSNMVVNLSLGFSDLVDDKGKKYAMHLVDTVKIGIEKGISLTDGVKSVKDTLFFENDADGEDEPKSAKTKKPPVKPLANGNPSPVKNKTVGGKVLRTKTRSAAQEEAVMTTAAKIKEHQTELHATLQADGLAKHSEDGGGSGGKEGKGWKRFQSYKGEAGLPKEVEGLKIYVDKKAQTIVLPVHGYAVPFHINTIKNASKNDEGDFNHLRINFQTPGQLAGKKDDTPFEDPDATFIRSVTYRSVDGHRFDNIYKQITELKKEANKREQQKKEMADVIEQDILQEIKGRRPHKLPEVFVRPALDGKRLPGEVEIHQNGLRYQSPLGSQKIDILFSNVKHLFFQPCDKELLVIIHIHLRAPIMIGKKKAHDVQFFREASDAQFDETGNRKRKHRYGDEDEIEMEQQERKRRQVQNKEFKSFSEKIADAGSNSTGDTLEVDIPFRELSFEGVPHRTNVRLQPTTECLVHLTDPPFLVTTLSEIEIASLERVQFTLKQFDLVLIFKDFTKPPLHINSIPSAQLDDVKNWLDSVDIALSEGPVNLNWGPIMKTINESPHDFFQQGGWSFLGGAGGDESDPDDPDSEESEFEADSDEVVSEASSDDVSDYDASDASEDDASASDFGGSESDEGDDWDELERKAAKSDMKRADPDRKGASDDSDEDRPKKKKPSNNGKSKPSNGKSRR